VSVSGPATRIGRGTARRFADDVTGAARDIERALGRAPAGG
jgi:DNA-binding IclR family transcriptional regulator